MRQHLQAVRVLIVAAATSTIITVTGSTAWATPTAPSTTAPTAAALIAAATNAGPSAETAARSIAASRGQVVPADATATDIAGLLATADTALRALGIEPFLNPSVAVNCVDPTADNPLGLAPGVAGAIAGPWSGGTKLPTIGGVDPNIVKDGQTAFAFEPSGISSDTTTEGMQVAWFNINTLQGGFVPMGRIGTTLLASWLSTMPTAVQGIATTLLTPVATALDATPGARLVPVTTGKGTVLATVFGTVTNGAHSCFFFPMVGVVNT